MLLVWQNNLTKSVAAPAGGSYESKKKYVVKAGNKLLTFYTAQAAMDALDKTLMVKPKPVEQVVPLSNIKALIAKQSYIDFLKAKEYDKMLSMYLDAQDEQDIEDLLLMA
jgi:hypothetical protein